MGKTGEGGLTIAEVALMKAMLSRGTFRNEQIAAYFNHPARTLNQGRVTDAKQGKRWADIEPATDEELDKFLALWEAHSPAPAAATAALGPLHPAKLRLLFPLNPHKDGHLAVDEGTEVEFKQSFQWKGRSKYAKSIAGMANNQGGYLLFGVENGSGKVVGIEEAFWDGLDPRKLSQFIGQNFAPAPTFSKGKMSLSGEVVGVLHISASPDKPVVCLLSDADLDNGSIYFRYPGEARAIRSPELLAILRDRDRRNDGKFASLVKKIQAIGTEEVALVDLKSGLVDGERGRFLLPEELLPHLRVIQEGNFSERDGAPALRLVGDLTVVGEGKVTVRKENLTDGDVIEDFLRQTQVANPKDYLRYLGHSGATWLPAYYYARLADLTDTEAADLIENDRKGKKARAKEQAKRIREHRLPKLGAQFRRAALSGPRADLIAGKTIDPGDDTAVLPLLKAVATLERDDMEVGLVLKPLLEVFEARYQTLADYPLQLFRNAVVRVDFLYFSKIT